MTRRLVAAVALALALCPGCTSTDVISGAELGEQLANDPSLGGDFNPFTCTMCHATSNDDERILAGYSLVDSAFRESYWGGYESTLLDAVSFCNQFFMGGSAIDEDSDEGRAIYEYLVSLSPTNPAAALPLTTVESIIDIGRGDPNRGEEIYDLACADCHGAVHTAEGRLNHSGLDEIVLPEITDDYPKMFPEDEPSEVVIEKVRHGRFFGVGGYMPPYSREALSDNDLGALLAFFEL